MDSTLALAGALVGVGLTPAAGLPYAIARALCGRRPEDHQARGWLPRPPRSRRRVVAA